ETTRPNRRTTISCESAAAAKERNHPAVREAEREPDHAVEDERQRRYAANEHGRPGPFSAGIGRLCGHALRARAPTMRAPRPPRRVRVPRPPRQPMSGWVRHPMPTAPDP